MTRVDEDIIWASPQLSGSLHGAIELCSREALRATPHYGFHFDVDRTVTCHRIFHARLVQNPKAGAADMSCTGAKYGSTVIGKTELGDCLINSKASTESFQGDPLEHRHRSL